MPRAGYTQSTHWWMVNAPCWMNAELLGCWIQLHTYRVQWHRHRTLGLEPCVKAKNGTKSVLYD